MTIQSFHVAVKDIFRHHISPNVSFACGILLLLCPSVTAQILQYPETPKQPVWDTLFGTVIRDDYRWLEDVNTPPVQSWLKEQAAFTGQLLEKIPGKSALIEEYKSLDQINNAGKNRCAGKRQANCVAQSVQGLSVPAKNRWH